METEEEDGGGGPVEKIDVDEDKNTPKAADEVDTTTVVKTPEAAEGSGEHHQEGDKMEDEDIHRQEEIEEEEMEHADDEGADGLEERANKEEKLNIPKEADEVDMTIVVKTTKADEGSGEHHHPDAAKSATEEEGDGVWTPSIEGSEEVIMTTDMVIESDPKDTEEQPTLQSRAGVIHLEAAGEVNMTTVIETESAAKDKEEQPATSTREEEPTLDEAAEINMTEVMETEDETKAEQPAAPGRAERGTEANEGTADQAGPSDGGRPL